VHALRRVGELARTGDGQQRAQVPQLDHRTRSRRWGV
jgi:hypothetical protein